MDELTTWRVQGQAFGQPTGSWQVPSWTEAVDIAAAAVVGDRASLVAIVASDDPASEWLVTLDRETHDVRVEHHRDGERVRVDLLTPGHRMIA